MHFTGTVLPPIMPPRKKTDSSGSSWPYRDGWRGPNCDHRNAERADHSGFPTGGETLRSLRGESVQKAFRGALAGQGPGNRSLPPAELAESGVRTVERHGGLDVVKEKIVQRERENPSSNGREMIDDFRLQGSRTWRRMDGPPKKALTAVVDSYPRAGRDRLAR